MPETPLDPTPEPQSPSAGAEAGAEADGAAEPNPSKWRKALTPVVLVLLGLVLFLLTIVFYPTGGTDVATPLYSRLAISTTFPLFLIGLTVVQISPTEAELKFNAELPAGTSAPPANGRAAVVFSPPLGISFLDCPAPNCRVIPGAQPGSEWGEPLVFTAGDARVKFFVKARRLGVAFNSVNATAAIPEVFYEGPGTPIFLVSYGIPSASSYDWSSFPTASVSTKVAIWQEDLTSVDTAGRAAVGINPSGQADHDTRAFIAGALIGLAGAAILSAVQEAMHAFADPG
jgi:hypothetical protein